MLLNECLSARVGFLSLLEVVLVFELLQIICATVFPPASLQLHLLEPERCQMVNCL